MDPFTMMALTGGMGALGAVAGGKKKNESSITGISSIADANASELMGGQLTDEQLKQLQGLVSQGPGAQDVTAGLESSRGLASMLEKLSQSGGLPGQEDIASAQGFANDIFAPQRQALDVTFKDEAERVAQLSAQLGRPVNDPILQAKLARSKGEQVGQLEAQKGAFSAEQARALPMQRLDFTNQLAGVRSGIASQAMSNRMALLSLGSQLKDSERNFRLQTATRRTSGQSGGGVSEAISGGLAGVGVGASLFGSGGIFGAPSTVPRIPRVGGSGFSSGTTVGRGVPIGMQP